MTGFLTPRADGRLRRRHRLAEQTGQPADTAAVRRYQSRTGLSLDLEQSLRDDLGLFVRAGMADGTVEPYEFADIDQTAAPAACRSAASAGGGRTTPSAWRASSTASRRFIRPISPHGGLGILVGDGKLPHPGPEEIVETYVRLVTAASTLTSDLRLPVRRRTRRTTGTKGPAPVYAVRMHAQF